MTKYSDNLASFTEWLLKNRPEVQALIASIEGNEMSQGEFVTRFTELGIPRLAPSKGRNMFNFLVKIGYLRSNAR